MPFAEPRAAYVHVPFCAHRCGYCDFTLVARRDDLIEDYLRALGIELRSLESPRRVETLFFGGGTPTHPAPEQLAGLLRLVREWLPPADCCEFSVEANPGDLDETKLEILAEAGVNRLSLGVQSFEAADLEILERNHRAEEIVAVVSRLKRRFENFSLDLIFGVPGQTLASWRKTLRRAIDLGPTHVSTYGLTFEQGTAFWLRREKGELLPSPEERERDMYATAMDDLGAAGYEQYEISSFARPGFRCRHNEVYWRGLPYFAFGPGAARYVEGRRETNVRSVHGWLKRMFAGESPVGEAEELSPEDRARELAVLGLRRTDGVDRESFLSDTGFRLEDLAAPALEKHLQAGWLEEAGSSVRLTREGRFVADHVVIDFLA